MNKLTEAQRRVLERGYCILYLDMDEKRRPVDVAYRTWSSLIDKGWIAHVQSNLSAKRPWERYEVTKEGLRALSDADGGSE